MNSQRYGNVTTQNGEKCNLYHFQAPFGIKEDKILGNLVDIKNNKSVALVADYRDENNSIYYVTVFARPGQDLEVRKLVLSLGWMSVKDIPKGLKEISRVLAN
jgi:hypothetical protein